MRILGFKIIEEKGTKVVIMEEFEKTNIVKHGFSTRLGGVSKGAYTTLNLGLKTKDNKEDVIKNINFFCKTINTSFCNLVLADQVHGDSIKIVTQEDRGKGIHYKRDYEGIDGLITNQRGLALMTFHADCVPLLFLDPVMKVVAASHAGWKGTMMKIGQKTVAKMIKEFGSNPQDILVGIGPSIGQCCYEVSEDVIKKFNTNFTQPCNFAIATTGEKYLLNLWEANRLQLEEIGVLHRNIIVSNMCTACGEDLFYSHRRDKGLTGRMASIIQLI
ncbi:peptidoglycan editing factor PgeF [Natronincola ferrireducens]|uniref:Purine nucleoside phosphorylase n=1 Tax=Natronincola ferrireducens TaxID=393762 RepID=A0A1G9BPC3_9FIRM|nr:peptidoglycan editing factor PgeF [Natronincola ferrireducens]SDK41110.1 conserved hypothetical protein [Natronincola ferrireducens]